MVGTDGAYSDRFSGGDEVGGYQVLESLGQGGMGVVYAAVHPVIGKRAAIKVMRKHLVSGQEAVKRFVLEARALSKIEHPNIVDVFAFGTLPDGRCYFVMEWLEGETLLARRRRGGFSVLEIAAIGRPVASALAAAHAAGIVHRDLKPANIMLTTSADGTGTVKLVDFGIAKMLEDEDEDGAQTSSGIIMGTPAYVSPEQARGVLDPRIDIYALGAILYEMLVGHPPLRAESNAELVAKILTEPVTPPSELGTLAPSRLEELILAMLEKDPNARPSLDDVEAVLRSLEGDPDPETERVQRALKPKRSGATVWVVCTGLIAASIVALWAVQRGRRTSEPASAAPPKPAVVAASQPDAAPAAGVLVVDTGHLEAQVMLDGKIVAAAAGRVTIPISTPGPHELEVTAADGSMFARRVTIGAGARVEVVAALVKPSPAGAVEASPARRATKKRVRKSPGPARRPRPAHRAKPGLNDETLAPSLGVTKHR